MYVHEYTQRESAKGYARCEKKREKENNTYYTHKKVHGEYTYDTSINDT